MSLTHGEVLTAIETLRKAGADIETSPGRIRIDLTVSGESDEVGVREALDALPPEITEAIEKGDIPRLQELAQMHVAEFEGPGVYAELLLAWTRFLSTSASVADQLARHGVGEDEIVALSRFAALVVRPYIESQHVPARHHSDMGYVLGVLGGLEAAHAMENG